MSSLLYYSISATLIEHEKVEMDKQVYINLSVLSFIITGPIIPLMPINKTFLLNNYFISKPPRKIKEE